MSVQNNADGDNFPKFWEESNRGGKMLTNNAKS